MRKNYGDHPDERERPCFSKRETAGYYYNIFLLYGSFFLIFLAVFVSKA